MKKKKKSKSNETSKPDETSHIFVYGGIVIKDVKSGNILIKKSF